jgi:hypothetical protein
LIADGRFRGEADMTQTGHPAHTDDRREDPRPSSTSVGAESVEIRNGRMRMDAQVQFDGVLCQGRRRVVSFDAPRRRPEPFDQEVEKDAHFRQAMAPSQVESRQQRVPRANPRRFENFFWPRARGISKRTNRSRIRSLSPFLGSPARLINLASSRKDWARVLPADKSPAGGQPRGGAPAARLKKLD